MRSMESIQTNTSNDMIREKLLQAVKDYKIAPSSLAKATGIDINWLSDYIDEKREIDDLSSEQYGSLFEMTIILADGIKMVTEDERVRGVINVLVEIFGLTHETISLYAGIEISDIENFIKDGALINYEKKYKLATASIFLHYLFKSPIYPIRTN